MPGSRPRNDSTVIKRLLPGVPGTKRLVERFGDALVCVRYRHDPLRKLRLTTVELIVEERPAKPEQTAWIRFAYVRGQIKEAGGIWHAERKLWLLPLRKIKAMKLEAGIAHDD